MGAFCFDSKKPHEDKNNIEELRLLLDEEEKEIASLLPKGILFLI